MPGWLLTGQVRVFGPVFEATAAKVALDVHARRKITATFSECTLRHGFTNLVDEFRIQELDRPAAAESRWQARSCSIDFAGGGRVGLAQAVGPSVII